jgi:hypothetical protein
LTILEMNSALLIGRGHRSGCRKRPAGHVRGVGPGSVPPRRGAGRLRVTASCVPGSAVGPREGMGVIPMIFPPCRAAGGPGAGEPGVTARAACHGHGHMDGPAPSDAQ